MRADLTIPQLNLTLCTDDDPPDCGASLTLAEPVPVQVNFHYAPGSPGRHTLPNGDPGYPPEPDELDIHNALCARQVTFHAPGITITIASGSDLWPLLPATLTEDLALDVLRAIEADKEDAAIDRAERRAEYRLEISPWDAP